jgi:hypothetical protein
MKINNVVRKIIFHEVPQFTKDDSKTLSGSLDIPIGPKYLPASWEIRTRQMLHQLFHLINFQIPGYPIQ